ncbi:MAG: hypothetical protein K9J16_06330 [Melioribacteraceae bacterium]|nr:hypothetical protein [Melioribacteraceae bacterium]MCF8394117.1 hypothetical protein [Melioribacteraceae bacterium]MCF8418145.1 hypothetical protein [Melioribacteraceae bacterium]
MKIFSTFLLFITFLFSNVMFAQSILHPNSSGFALNLGYTLLKDAGVFSQSLSASPTGHYDISISHSDDHTYGIGFDYYFNNQTERLLVPTISISYIFSNYISSFSVGGMLNINAVRKDNLAFIPQIGGGALYILRDSSHRSYYGSNSSAIGAKYFAMLGFGIASYIGDFAILSFSPGISYVQEEVVFGLTAGLVVTPF